MVMRANKIVVSLLLCAAMVSGFLPINSRAAEDYISTDDLTDNNTNEPSTWGVLPTPEQYRYQKEELAAFVHFGPNTFNEIEWGQNYGDKTPDEIFKLEEDFDAATLVESLKSAGFKKVIVTAKHHDGFIIWNSAYTDYDVAATSYKNGQGDILAELSAACTAADIDMGLYLSPWDIHAPEYGYYDGNGEPTTADKDVLDYNDYYVNQLNEILGNSKYGNNGHFNEIWMDGAKGSGSDAQVYDFQRWYDTIQNQEGIPAGFDSECMIFQCGANTTVRWIGNENGYAAKNTWSKSNVNIAANTCNDNLNGEYSLGYEDGNKWTVPEADARITSGWFWGTKKNTPKSLSELGNMYFGSVGNNATLLLNIPPNNQGKVDQEILDRVAEFGDNIQETFSDNLASAADIKASSVRGNDLTYSPSNVFDGDDATYWTTDDETNTGSLLLDLGETKVFDVVSIEEAIQFGQSINEYKIEYRTGSDGSWKVMDEGETIGAKRLARTTPIRADQIRITVSTNKADAVPIISEVGVYKASEGFGLGGSIPGGMDFIDVSDTNISDGNGFTFNGKWTPETGSGFVGGTNTWANTGSSTTVSFHGSKIYLIGTKDPNHGTATISIDGGPPVSIDTNSAPRATGQFLYSSEDLEDGDHTLTLTVDSKAIGLEAAYVINNGGLGMIGLEYDAYTMNEDETINVKITRVGGTTGEVKATLQPNPGSAIQDDYNTELIPDIILQDGESETTVPVATKRNTNVTGNRVFSIVITNPSENLIVGFNEKAKITIKDTESSSMEGLLSLIEKASEYQMDWYASGTEAFESALNNAKAVANDPEATLDEMEAAIDSLSKAMDALVKREHYTQDDRFQFPWKKDTSAILEAEFSIIDNDTSNDNGWPCVIAEGDWASNGQYIDAINKNDKLKVYYTADKPGTYHAVLSYQSGSQANGVTWSEESGKIESGSVSAGASGVGTTYTAEFDFVVTEAGDGVLVFTGPDGKSPRMDHLVITPSDIILNEYTVTATATSGGSISDAGENIVTEGDNKTFTITPDEGYRIKDVLLNGTSVGVVSSYTVENVSEDLEIEAIFEFSQYSSSNSFAFPTGDETVTLEVEHSIIVNDPSNDNGWPCVIAEGDWASNGQYIDAINKDDKLKVHYTADRPGTYHAVLSYQSGSNTNAVTWSEENGKIASGSFSAGASKTGTTYTAEFDFVVEEAGDGVLIFTGPDGKSPRMDKIDITYTIALDTAALEAAISTAEAITQENYTEASVAELNEALEAAKTALTEAATQTEIDNAAAALTTAIENLVEKEDEPINKTELEELIAAAETIAQEDYTEESAAQLNDALEAAKTALTEAATQAEIDNAAAALATAIEDLEEKEPELNKAELEKLIAAAESVVQENYTEESTAQLQEALEAAKAAMTTAATQAEIDNAATALAKAVESLVEKEPELNKAELEQLIASAEAVVQENYTEESAAQLQQALEAAKAALTTAATQEEIDTAVAALTAAMDNLEAKKSENQPEITPPSKPSKAPETETKPAPATNDASNITIYLIVMLLSLGVVVLLKKHKKLI